MAQVACHQLFQHTSVATSIGRIVSGSGLLKLQAAVRRRRLLLVTRSKCCVCLCDVLYAEAGSSRNSFHPT